MLGVVGLGMVGAGPRDSLLVIRLYTWYSPSQISFRRLGSGSGAGSGSRSRGFIAGTCSGACTCGSAGWWGAAGGAVWSVGVLYGRQ